MSTANSSKASSSQHKQIKFEEDQSTVNEKQMKRVREMFPFANPYPQQIKSMDVILSCLNQRKNLLLECPTGTGKSLMLLTSLFTYIEANPSQYQILFLTKTNGQVNGLVKELNKIRDADELTSKYAILAGRSQLCIRKTQFKQYLYQNKIDGSKSKNINKNYEAFCTDCKQSFVKSSIRQTLDSERILDVSVPIDHQARKALQNQKPFLNERACENFALSETVKDYQYTFNGFSRHLLGDESSKQEPKLPDIEDMTQLFQANNAQCPYYFNKYIAKQANLVFMNYNYLLSPEILSYVSKNVLDNQKRSIIVFDEAHNIEQQAEAQFQTKIKMSTIQKVLSTIVQIQITLRLAHTLGISDYVLEEGITLLERQRETAIKGERIETKENINDGRLPFEINLKIEESNENASKITSNQSSTDSKFKEAPLTQDSRNRQALKEIPQNSIQSNECSQSKKIIQSCQEQLDDDIKIKEETQTQLIQEISSNISQEDAINLTAQNKVEEEDDEIFILEEEQEADITNREKELELIYQELNYVQTQKSNESSDISKIDMTVLDSQVDSISSAHQKFDSQKQALVSIFSNYEEIIPSIISYLGHLERFCEKHINKSSRPESFLMSEFAQVKKYYDLFGLLLKQSNEANKENVSHIKEEDEESKSILSKVATMISEQGAPDPTLFEKNYKFLKSIETFANIFHTVLRFIKVKFSKLSQQNELAKYLASARISMGNLHQQKMSMHYFANTIVQLQHVHKIQKITNFLTELESFYELSVLQQRFKKKKTSTYEAEECFNLQSSDLQKLQDFYLSIQTREDKPEKNIVFTLGCLSGKYAFRSIQAHLNVHSIILCSGTLAPFDILTKNLELTFQTHVSSHVIDPSTQLFTKFVTHSGQFGEPLNFSFNRNYMDDLQIAEQNYENIVRTLEIIKLIVSTIVSKKSVQGGGVIVFSKSYELMHSFQKVYYGSIFQKALDGIPVYFEQTNNAAFQEDFTSFKKNVQMKKKTCLFFAACRGKLSEGIDLNDDLARSVIVVGIPFWNITDPYFVSKKKYIERVLKMDPNDWVKKQVIKCVNQAAGRSIRHKQDWGSVFFLCQKFTEMSRNPIIPNLKNLISPWVLEAENTSGDYIRAFSEFLDSHLVTQPKIKSIIS